MPEQTRKLAAIVFTDIVGFTKLSAVNEPAALSLLEKQRELLKPIVEKNGGSWLKEIGDGLLLSFETTKDAVDCAIEIQNVVKEVQNLNLRIGIHQGEVVFQGSDVIGDDVNIAARIEPFAAPGGVAISGRVNASLERDPDFQTHYLGQPQLKGVSQTVKAYCITSHGLPKTDMSKVNAKLEPDGFKWDVKNTIGIAASMIGLFMLINFMFLRVGYADKDETPSIAILPFENKGAEADEYYAYGISSDLITDVTGAGLIRVASMGDIEKLDYKNLENNELAKKLFVRYVAKGTLWKMDSIFQLSMEIFDTKSSKVVYNKRWETAWKDLATIKDDLSDNILETLKIEVLRDVEDQIVESNPEAYEYYLRAKHLFNRREIKDDIAISRDLLNKALQLDSNFVESKILLAYTYRETDYETSLKHYFEALDISKRLNDKESELTIKANLGVIYSDLYDDENALKYLIESNELAKEVGNENSLAKSLNALGSFHFQRRTEETRFYFGEVLKIAKELEDNKRICSALNNIGLIYWIWDGDIDKAINAFEESIQYAEEMDNYNMAVTPASNIAIIYNNQGKYDLSQKHYKKLLKHAQDTGNLRSEGFLKLFMSRFYNKTLEYDTALEYLKSSYEINHEVGSNRWRNIALSEVLFCYIALNDEENIKRFQKEIDDLGDGFHTTESYGWLAWDLFKIGNYTLALKYIEKQVDIETLNENVDVLNGLHYSMGYFLFYNGDYEKALGIFDNLIANAEKDGEEDDYEFQIFKCLAMKNLGLPYDIEKLQALIKKEESENPTWKEKMSHVTALELFNLLGDRDYINIAHKELDHLFSYMTPENREIASTFPINKAIIKAYNRVLN
jgi:class 3 adenylate cyclase/TolB-like protein/Tfp pilus assembly protein PilF